MIQHEVLKFDEKTHTYWLDSDKSIKFTSGTSVLKGLFKPFNPKGASYGVAKCILKEFQENETFNEDSMPRFARLYGDVAESYFQLFKQEKYTDFPVTTEVIQEIWKAKGEKASAFGTEVHNALEDFILSGLIKEHFDFDESVNKFKHGLNWLKLNINNGVYFAEFRLYDKDLAIAGTADILRKNEDGTYSILDWKTSQKIDTESNYKLLKPFNYLYDCELVKYSLQMFLYKHILEKNYGITVRDCTILHLTDDECIEIPCVDLSKEIEQILENWKP